MMASVRCSTLTHRAFSSSAQPARVPARRWTACRAGPERDAQPVTDTAAESRVEALEAAIRGKAPKAQRQIPIRGVTQPQPKQESSQYAEWKEGKLFPEGWEQMPVSEFIHSLHSCSGLVNRTAHITPELRAGMVTARAAVCCTTRTCMHQMQARATTLT
jgi:hypothetical protein